MRIIFVKILCPGMCVFLPQSPCPSPLWRFMEYRIFRSKTLEGLEEDVNAAMAEGWAATGGPMNQPFGFAGYFQAMVRD